jgi:hypothetical protein
MEGNSGNNWANLSQQRYKQWQIQPGTTYSALVKQISLGRGAAGLLRAMLPELGRQFKTAQKL